MRRLAGTVAVVLVLVGLPALADVEFDESAQENYGLTGQGVDVEGAEGMGNYDDAWDLFTSTVEGARILGRLDGSRQFDITVQVLTAEEYEDDTVWGESILFKQPNDRGQKRVQVTIIKDDTRSVKQIADTIYHEFRHVEHWLDEDFDEGHDDIHDSSDDGLLRYRRNLDEVMSGTSSTTTTTIGVTRTPIYDSIVARSWNGPVVDAPMLHRIFDEIGEALDSIRRRQDEAVYVEAVDIDVYMVNKFDYGALGVEVNFNESIFECGDRGEQYVVCDGSATDMPAGEVMAAGMQLVADVPLDDPDRSYIYSLVADTDSSPVNNWVFNPPFDWDLFQGTDTWWQLVWDHQAGAWSLSRSLVDGSGGISTVATAARVVIEGNTIVFFAPLDEVGDVGVRFTAFHHDGFFGEETRGADVSGVDPTEALTEVPATVWDAGW